MNDVNHTATNMLRLSRSWHLKRHSIALFLIAYSSISASENLCFNDLNLSQLQAQQSPETAGVLLYVWSPRMALSAQHAATAAQQAQANGLGLVALHDAQVGDAELGAALARMAQSSAPVQQSSSAVLGRSLPLCAPALLERDAQRHFPTAWVLQRSGLHPRPIVGAMPAQAWALSLQQRTLGPDSKLAHQSASAFAPALKSPPVVAP
jgi:hypothetical protein